MLSTEAYEVILCKPGYQRVNCSATVLLIFSRFWASLIISFYHCFCVYNSHFHTFICLTLTLDHCSMLHKPIHSQKFCRKRPFRVKGPFSGRCLAKTNPRAKSSDSFIIYSRYFKTYLSCYFEPVFIFFVLAMFFRQNFGYFFIAKRVKFSVPALPKELTQPCPQGLSVPSLFLAQPVPLTSFFRIPQKSSIFGQRERVMKNQPSNLSQ